MLNSIQARRMRLPSDGLQRWPGLLKVGLPYTFVVGGFHMKVMFQL